MTEAQTSNTQQLMLELAQTKAQLQKLETYRWIVESSTDFILVINRDYNVEFINRAGPQVSVFTKGDISVLSFIAPEYHQQVTAAFEAVLHGQEFASYRSHGGETSDQRWYETRVSPVHAENDIKNLVLISTDITDQVKAEDALRQSERQYRQILDSIEDFVLVKGPESRIVWANQSFREYYGMSAEELKGMIDSPVSEPDFTQQYIIDDAKVYNTGQPLDIPEEQVKRHDGVIRLFNTVKSPIFNELGQVIMTVGVSRDITERKLIEQERARLASIVETTSDFVGSAHLDGRVIYINPAGRRMAGIQPDADVTTMTITELSPDWANEIIVRQAIPTAMRESVWTGETAVVDRDGHETPVSQTIIVHRDANGDPMFMSTITRDISEQKKAAAERERLIKDLQAARRIAEENSRLKSEFLATMSHELRTPLNAIEGFTSIMMSKMGGAEYNDKTERYVSRVNTNSRRLLSLINDFLDLSRVESGRLELAHMPFSPAKLAKRWQDEIGVLAEKKSIDFEVTIDEELPDILYGDEESISKIGLNLLSNAIKFTEQGSVTLVLEKDEDEWRVIVTDTGIGIPPHAREYVFEEFRQVDQTSKRKYGGTGLGLAIVQKYTRAMGGSVTLQTELGKGSVFTVSLPLTVSNKEGERP